MKEKFYKTIVNYDVRIDVSVKKEETKIKTLRWICSVTRPDRINNIAREINQNDFRDVPRKDNDDSQDDRSEIRVEENQRGRSESK